jgi:2-polyprenyl-6-methoxyphenol hydroxylase-like FAD-dependent oxidoreductase
MDLRYGALGEGTFGLGIHRAALFDVLHRALTRTSVKLFLGFDVVAMGPFARPFLTARDGRKEGPFDLVLDCAGAHDTLRDALPCVTSAPLYPWGALWTTRPDPDGRFSGELSQRYRGTRMMIGVLPVGRVPGEPVDERLVAFFWSLKLSERDRMRDAGIDAFKTRVFDLWPDAADAIADIGSFEEFSLATYRDVHVAPWRKDRILVMGDAAHGTSPQLGQGANLALIDAIVLAGALDDMPDIDAALALYERRRRPHVRYYQLASRLLTPFFQSDHSALGWVRDLLLGPLGKLPLFDHVMRTTLAGTRKFPLGLYRSSS